VRFVKITAVKITLYLQLSMKRCQFYIFSPNLDKIRFRKRSQKCTVSFNVKISEESAVVYLGAQTKFNPFFPHCRPIWVKFGITGLHIMLLSIGEFSENRYRKAVLLLLVLMQLRLQVCRETVWHFECKERLSEVCVLLTASFAILFFLFGHTASPVITTPLHIILVCMHWHKYISVKYSAT
jgi:hypothetical protein